MCQPLGEVLTPGQRLIITSHTLPHYLMKDKCVDLRVIDNYALKVMFSCSTVFCVFTGLESASSWL